MERGERILMEALAKIIGPAPSEMTLEELEEAVRREHSRIAEGLAGGARTTKKKTKTSAKVNKAKNLEEKFGMSLEEMKRKLELLKKLEEKGGL